jgi:hypothetical protein
VNAAVIVGMKDNPMPSPRTASTSETIHTWRSMRSVAAGESGMRPTVAKLPLTS